jgi:hypothetical protein
LLYTEAVICSIVSLLAIVFFRGEPPSPPSAAAELRSRVHQVKGQGLQPLAYVLGVFTRRQNLVAPTSSLSEKSGRPQAPLTELGLSTPAVTASNPHSEASQTTEAADSSNIEMWRMDSYQNGGFIPGQDNVDGVSVDLEDDDEEHELLNDTMVPFTLLLLFFSVRAENSCY